MSDPFYSPAIVYATGTIFLPLPISEWRETAAYRNNSVIVPRADGELLLSQRKAVRIIEVSGIIVGYTSSPYTTRTSVSREAAWAIKTELETALDGPFKLFRYADSCYENCVLDSAPFFFANEPDVSFDYSLRIKALSPKLVIGEDSVSGSPYQALTHGNDSEEGGSTPVSNNNPQNISYTLFGMQNAITEEGAEIQIPLPGPAGVNWTITRLAVLSVSGVVGSGSTTVVISTTGVGGGGSNMSVSLANDETSGENTSGFTIGGTADLYLYVTDAGGHADLQLLIQYEVA